MAAPVPAADAMSAIEERLLDYARDRTPNSSIESTPEPPSAVDAGIARDPNQPQKRKGGRKPVSSPLSLYFILFCRWACLSSLSYLMLGHPKYVKHAWWSGF